MTENLLRHEASPYLLQHKDNPVHWRPWGPAALDEATAANKPILLSIGYAACHWCHVMAHESFEDPTTAAVMNRLFVNIKVDREERPEVDQIYMAALHALGEQGGWPLTMFLAPDGKPIWGGTYFPNKARYGRAAFVDVLTEVARLYRDEPDKIAHNTALLIQALAERPTGEAATLDVDFLDRAASRLYDLMDRERGGIRGLPKFPQASLLEFLWRAGARTRQTKFAEIVLVTLRNIAQGGIYDHIGGGFSRYSVDDRWLVPHFEKMLYDNAQFIELMTSAFLKTGDPLFRARIDETIAWLGREMLLPGGAFAASLDADSEGHEGRFYVWTLAEILSVLGPSDGPFFADIYEITDGGNWDGVSIPNRLKRLDLSDAATESRLTILRARLLIHRAQRTRPGLDDKILADWNGLTIAALARAGASLDRPDWIALARSAYRFVLESMTTNNRLAHSARARQRIFPGLATDYAAMIRAAIALYSATFEHRYITEAESLAAVLRTHHWDETEPGYFLPADDAEALIMRPKSDVDEATPSADALMGANLVRLWRLTGNDRYRDDVDRILEASASSIASNLFAATGVLNTLDLRLGAVDLAIIAQQGSAADLIATARRVSTPNTIISVHTTGDDLPAGHPAAGKPAVGGKATAYVCRSQTCSLPVTRADALAALLA
ncbi:MAG: thioredoxin domain-containing protein [Bauldia sp.]